MSSNARTRRLPWLGNLLLDAGEWLFLTSGFGFREYRRLGRQARRDGENYWREARVTSPGRSERGEQP